MTINQNNKEQTKLEQTNKKEKKEERQQYISQLSLLTN